VANVVANAVIVAILIISVDLVVHVVVFFAGSSSSSFESKLCRSSSEWVASFIIVIYTHNERV
jgi:hypothetical protein